MAPPHAHLPPYQHCHKCGTEYEATDWPRVCPSCTFMVWRPIHPVAVLVQPVLCREQNKTGVIIGRRGINPFKGEFALPGGFVEFGETAEAAARREIFEEMQMKVGDIHFSHTYADDEGHFLVFFHGGLIYREHLEAMFMGSSECPEMAIAFEPQNLCFPSHTQALERYLNSI